MMNSNQKHLKKYLYGEGIIDDNNYYAMKMRFHHKKNIMLANINKCLTNINQNSNLVEKIYWVMNDLSDYPKTCKMCSNKIKNFNTRKEPYKANYCSNKCSQTCPEMKACINETLKSRSKKEIDNIVERRQQTNLKKYGHINAAQSEEIQKKIKKTNVKRYGHENALSSKEIQKKVKQTNLKKYGHVNAGASDIIQRKIQTNNLKKYGVKSTFQVSEFQEKAKKSMLKKYGVDHNMKSPEIRERIKKTNLERYGAENVFELDEFQEKAKNTIKEKYGVDNVFQSETIKQKSKETNLKRYGVEYPNQNPAMLQIMIRTKCEKFYHEQLNKKNNNVIPLFNAYEYYGTNSIYKYKYKWKCTKCNNIFETGVRQILIIPRCHKCHPLNQSKGEAEVKDFLIDLSFDLLGNDRQIIKPYELDIIIPEKKIAIEYCGLYWHSELNGKSNDYHSMKFDMCQRQGYRLITIFEDEWINKRDICKNRLTHILGISDTTCYARQTIIKEINGKEHKDFLNKHHIQGFIGAKIKLGAYYNDELVAVMSFGKKRRALGNKTQTPDTYELLRFCTKGNIPGIGSKLFKHFTRNYKPEEIISYCNLRWGTGDFYEKLFFVLSHTSKPNYWYFKNQPIRHHRYGFRKSTLTNVASYAKDKTEWQIMQEEGYDRIWDCGNKVYSWHQSTIN